MAVGEGSQLQDVDVCQARGSGGGFLALDDVVDLHLRGRQPGVRGQCGHDGQPSHDGSECLED